MLETLKMALARHPRLFDAALRIIPPRSQAEEFFASLGDGVRFVQIGANDGLRWDPLRRSIIRQRWTGLVIEPLPGVFSLLQRHYAHVLGVRSIQVAIGARDEVLRFWTVSQHFLDGLHEEVQLFYLRKSSFQREAVENALTRVGDGERQYLAERGHIPGPVDLQAVVVPVEVQCLTLNSLLAQHWHTEVPHLVAIDAEGHEAKIIPAIDFSVVRPRILFYEACNLVAEDRDRVEAHLRRAGYSVRPMGGDAIAMLP